MGMGFAPIWLRQVSLPPPPPLLHKTTLSTDQVPKTKTWTTGTKQEFVRPRWPYDMRPSARAEKYIRDAGP